METEGDSEPADAIDAEVQVNKLCGFREILGNNTPMDKSYETNMQYKIKYKRQISERKPADAIEFNA